MTTIFHFDINSYASKGWKPNYCFTLLIEIKIEIEGVQRLL